MKNKLIMKKIMKKAQKKPHACLPACLCDMKFGKLVYFRSHLKVKNKRGVLFRTSS